MALWLGLRPWIAESHSSNNNDNNNNERISKAPFHVKHAQLH